MFVIVGAVPAAPNERIRDNTGGPHSPRMQTRFTERAVERTDENVVLTAIWREK